MFCRVRPLLPDDGSISEGKIISYPTSMEALGRGIDIVQNGILLVCRPSEERKLLVFFLCIVSFVHNTNKNVHLSSGQKHSFTFDKVFMPDASQEDVFEEISQLVQSALDGYKVTLLFFDYYLVAIFILSRELFNLVE